MSLFHPSSGHGRSRPMRAIVMAALILSGTLVAVVHAAPTASAAQSCKSGSVCIFTGNNYTGWGLTVPAYSGGTCMNLPSWYSGTYNNSITSFISNGEFGTFYKDNWCKGSRKEFYGTSDGSRDKDLNITWDNKISSIYFW